MEHHILATAISTKPIGKDSIQAVDARMLHEFLENGDAFANWIKDRIEQYGFIAGFDYEVFRQSPKNSKGGRPSEEYAVTIGMAKELCMVEKNARGKEARVYFIEMEEKAKQLAVTLPQDYASALRAAADLYERTQKQEAQLKELEPKGEFYDQVALAINAQDIMEVAKVLGTGRTRLFKFLRDKGILLATSGHKNIPKQEYIERGYFRVTERSFTDPRGETRTYTKTLVTGKGIEWLQKLLVNPALAPAT